MEIIYMRNMKYTEPTRPVTRLVAAAIKVGDKIWTGKRHFSLITQAIADGALKPIKQDQQGFLGDNLAFIPRAAATAVARMAGQYKGTKEKILSEDLW